jgi:hypothetical protein
VVTVKGEKRPACKRAPVLTNRTNAAQPRAAALIHLPKSVTSPDRASDALLDSDLAKQEGF